MITFAPPNKFDLTILGFDNDENVLYIDPFDAQMLLAYENASIEKYCDFFQKKENTKITIADPCPNFNSNYTKMQVAGLEEGRTLSTSIQLMVLGFLQSTGRVLWVDCSVGCDHLSKSLAQMNVDTRDLTVLI